VSFDETGGLGLHKEHDLEQTFLAQISIKEQSLVVAEL